jgi:hypothetical protein
MAFDPQRYEQEVIRPLRGWRGRLPEDDLMRRYGVEPGMSADALRAQLHQIRMYWNQKANGPTASATVCKLLRAADEELKRTAGAQMEDPAWWQARAQQHQQKSRREIDQLAADLQHAYQALGQLTRAQLAVLAANFPGLTAAQIDEAVRKAKLRVVEAVDLPTASGLDRTAYSRLSERLTQLNHPTIVQLLHPDLNQPFTLVQSFTVAAGGRRQLDRAVVEARLKETQTAADSTAVRARKEALGVLRTGLDAGADLRTVALYQVVDQISAGRARQLPDVLLVRQATELGLTEQDARLLVASLPTTVAPPEEESASLRVRELLQEGNLRAAERALAAVAANDPDRDGVRKEVETRHAKVEQLIRQSTAAQDGHKEDEARRLLQEACQIACDDESLATRLRQLPLPPPRDPAAAEAGATVRLSWRAPSSPVDQLRYCVMRAEGRVPASPQDGHQVAATTQTSAVDRDPPVARQLRYAVFASIDGGVWSRAAEASATVTPSLTEVKVKAHPDHIVATWSPHAAVVAVRVRRTVGRPPTGPDDGTPVASATESFTDHDIVEGREYFYGLVAVYHDGRRQEVAAPMVLASASPRAAASPVEGLTVEPLSVNSDGGRVRITWPNVAAAQVRIRYGEHRPSWETGAVIAVADVDRFGREVVGVSRVQAHQTVLEADVTAGQHVYVPFSIGGTGAVVGSPVVVGVTEPVRQLSARRIGAEVDLSWVWPPDVAVVQVAWHTPELGTQLHRVTKSQYLDGGGFRLAVGIGGGTATVTAIAIGPLGDATAPPVSATVDGRTLRVSYDIRRPAGLRGLGSRKRQLQVRADDNCVDLELILVAATGHVMPLRPDQGTVVNRYEGLAFARDVPLHLDIEVPEYLRRPYWLRCFVTKPDRVTVIDPPVDNLKVS